MRVTPCRGNTRERTPPFKYMCFLACQSLHRIAAPRHSTQKRRPHTTGTTQKRLSVYGETFATSQMGASAHVVRKAQAPRSNVAGTTHDTLRSIAQAQHHLDTTLLMRMGQRRHRPIRRPFRCDLTKPLGRARRARWARVIPDAPCAGASCSRSA
ncbi:hypothetical protein XFF6992_160030 [Xanthomonas citri pv. fuscans]|nr:hypothetical protein XFF6992_160030 [Xanthomonas citri pv. fuscans]SOO36172.1 hypothetical protein XFF6994_780015 [Xanthomonas citri pv. fuscans]